MFGPISWVHFNFDKFNFLVSKFFISLSKFDIVIHFNFEHISNNSISGFSTILQRSKDRYFTSSYILWFSPPKNQPTIGSYFYRSVSDSQNNVLFHSPLHFYWSCVFRRPSDKKHLATKLVIINIIDLEINVFIHNYFTTGELGVLRSSDTQ